MVNTLPLSLKTRSGEALVEAGLVVFSRFKQLALITMRMVDCGIHPLTNLQAAQYALSGPSPPKTLLDGIVDCR